MTGAFAFPPTGLPAVAERLRGEVRAFLAGHGAGWTLVDRAHGWTRFDRAFSRAVGARGWIGMTWPKAYGGHERSALERYVVLEEMLAAGAPVGAHWFGDRQSGPLLLKAGTEAQRRDILPRIAAGEFAFCIGLSEPDSGSDLASLRTRATRVDGGWRIDGTKVWTTNAHACDYMIALVRTSPAAEGAPRHAGLSQFLIDLTLPGIAIRPIADLTGEAHFNEVHFDAVTVGDDRMIGAEGEGWAQANAELAYERSGPDRYLSSFPVLPPALARMGPAADEAIGRLMARYATLRGMSLSIAALLEAGATPLREAALVKDLGVDLEQTTPEVIADLLDIGPALAGDGGLEDALAFLTQTAPTFSLRGGTREIMRGMTARGLGAAMSELRDLLLDQAERLFTDLVDREALATAERGGEPAALVRAIDEFGLPDALAVPAEAGGLTFADAGALFALLGYHAVPLPIGETMLARALLARTGMDVPAGTIGLIEDVAESPSVAGGQATAWAVAGGDGRLRLFSLDANGRSPTGSLSRGGRMTIDPAAPPAAEAAWPHALPDTATLGAMLRASQIAGALSRVLALSVDHANTRQQFGRPIGRFQAMQQLLAKLAAEAAAARSAADVAWASLDAGALGHAGAVAKIRAGEAARAGAAIAHQVHGAIGVTDEHILHYFTRRLWEWRLDFGSDGWWAARLGRALRESGGDAWTMLTGRCGAPAAPEAA